jgi:hypothetical protein
LKICHWQLKIPSPIANDKFSMTNSQSSQTAPFQSHRQIGSYFCTDSNFSFFLFHFPAYALHMAAHDASDFVDSDFESAHPASNPAPSPDAPAGSPRPPNRPPTGEEIEAMVSQKHIKLAELKRAQEELERERAALEELRRRQMEFQTGRAEMLQHLTRGIGLLEEAELNARRESDQMSRTLGEFRQAASKVQSLNEQLWTQDNFSVELTRALTTLENARMEWNSARLKFAILSDIPPVPSAPAAAKASLFPPANTDLLQLCKIGFALSLPLVVLGMAILVVLLLRR